MIRRPHRHPRSAIDRRPAVDRTHRLNTKEFIDANPTRVHVVVMLAGWQVWQGARRISNHATFDEAIASAQAYARSAGGRPA